MTTHDLIRRLAQARDACLSVRDRHDKYADEVRATASDTADQCETLIQNLKALAVHRIFPLAANVHDDRNATRGDGSEVSRYA
jgi:hypothetical protein